jgi:hypothetical protein
MKKQMKANLFTAVIGCCLFGAFLMSATDNTPVSAVNHQQSAALPDAAIAAPEVPGIPFTFFYTLVTTFTNGGSINMDLSGEEEQIPIWDNPAAWSKEQ